MLKKRSQARAKLNVRLFYARLKRFARSALTPQPMNQNGKQREVR